MRDYYKIIDIYIRGRGVGVRMILEGKAVGGGWEVEEETGLLG